MATMPAESFIRSIRASGRTSGPSPARREYRSGRRSPPALKKAATNWIAKNCAGTVVFSFAPHNEVRRSQATPSRSPTARVPDALRIITNDSCEGDVHFTAATGYD